MTRKYPLPLFLASLLTFSELKAAEPTIAAKNAVVDNITCTSARIAWSNGNGSWRTVVLKEGSAVDSDPVDGVRYTSSSTFAMGSEIGTGNYVCYNNITNSFTVTGLQQGKTYYLAVYEHDALAPDYLTSTPATASFTTKDLQLGFTYSYTDSCQNTNVIYFKNTSTTDLTGVTYTWDFKDGNQTTGFDAQHTYMVGGNFSVRIIASPAGGCKPDYVAPVPVRVIPRPSSKPVEKNGKYAQCFTGNHFYFDDQTTLAPVPKCAYIRTWHFEAGVDSATFPTPDRVWSAPGNYRIFFESETLFNGIKTGCTDTTSIYIRVIPDPSTGVVVDDSLQCLAGNLFGFDNEYPGLVSFSWDFDDGGSSTAKTITHVYADTGIYHVLHKAASIEGCKSEITKIVFVKPNTTAAFTGLPLEVCELDPPLHLLPSTSGGIWSGSYLTDSVFTPSTPGSYTITHVIPDSFCSDTVIKPVTVKPTPKFTLGNDASICNGASFDMTVNAPGTIVWDDGSTAATRSVTTEGTYWAKATDNGCSWTDSIELFIGNTPIIKLPEDTSLCKGAALQLTAEWPGSDVLWSTGSREKSIYVTSAGTYSVSVTNPCGVGSDAVTVHFQGGYCDVFIPDAFTPNGDGHNEYFEILGKGITPSLLMIYDRWGAKVFDSRTDNGFRWYGMHNGEQCADAVYSYFFYYEVSAGDFVRKNAIKGSVLLYR